MDTVTKLFGVRPPRQYKSLLKPVDCSNPDLVIGLELETENASPDSAYYSAGLGKAWRIDRDGSLRGEQTAYEFISHPLPLGVAIPELEAFFKFTKFDDSNYSDRCSVHVHTNVTDYTQDMLASLGMVYTVFEDVLFQFVNHYGCKEKDGHNRDTNIYCIPWNQCRMNHRLVEKMFSNTNIHLAQWQKYTALNLLPITAQGTVEWRHMHGTADMKKLTIWLNLIGSIMDYSRRTQLDDVIKTVKTLNDTSAYRQFFTAVLRDYLQYDDAYQRPMSEGVINAKYSLLDWDRNKVGKPLADADNPSIIGSAAWLRARGVEDAPVMPQTLRGVAPRNPLAPRVRNPVEVAPGRFQTILGTIVDVEQAQTTTDVQRAWYTMDDLPPLAVTQEEADAEAAARDARNRRLTERINRDRLRQERLVQQARPANPQNINRTEDF